jgi:hypothetical protein
MTKNFRNTALAGLAAMTLAGATAGPAKAVVFFTDNFNGETLGLNYTSFANWAVTAGSVDLIGTPVFFDFYPGNGRYVDLDGSTGAQNPAGRIATNTTFAAGNYKLTFNLGGSTRGDTNTVEVKLGSFTQLITLGSAAGFTSQSFLFSTTGGKLSFANLGNSDNLGLILDNVQVASGVPEPGTWAMMLLGFVGLGYLGARRRRTVAAA